jgi:hypothetical protein
MQLMLMETEGDQWIYRREPKIRGAIASIGSETEAGLPYLRPEIQLLYKAKPPIAEKDQCDFALAAPHLSEEARQWLLRALSMQFSQGHEWIDALRDTSVTEHNQRLQRPDRR